MLKESNILADLHTHTIESKHAYSTIGENIAVARNRNLKYLASTDHLYQIGDAITQKNERCYLKYMEERVNSNPAFNNLHVIGGVELNLNHKITNFSDFEKLKWRLLGLHNWFVDIKELSIEEIYVLFKEYSFEATAFAHIERELHKVAYGVYGNVVSDEIKEFLTQMVLMAKDKDIILEANESSIVTNECGGVERLRFWLMKAKENCNIISLGTDAHYCSEVGNFKNIINLLNEINYPKELILNMNPDMLQKLFG